MVRELALASLLACAPAGAHQASAACAAAGRSIGTCSGRLSNRPELDPSGIPLTAPNVSTCPIANRRANITWALQGTL